MAPPRSIPDVYRSEVLELQLPSSRPVRLVLVADTHSAPHPSALEQIQALEPDGILHAGDIGSVGILDGFRKVAPLHVVRGNIDGRGQFPDHLDLSVQVGGVRWAKIFLTHYALRGPRLLKGSLEGARRYGADLVVCGHSHVPFIGNDRGMGVFNPGSIGPRRFSLPIVFGVVELRPGAMTPWHVSCETGERWMPGGV